MVEFTNYTEPKYRINERGKSIIGISVAMIDIFQYINQLADLPTNVLLRGETGTGKELVAQALHFNGIRGKGHRFVAIDCAGIPSGLLESELFGHEKGAFTTAYYSKAGKFELAYGGTIFLDEIGDMDLGLQAKILRVLQERLVTRVGGNEPKKVDVRVVAATNKDLETMISKGQFREDLYYRLNVAPIYIPPLRERRRDIIPLTNYLIEKLNEKYSSSIGGIDQDAMNDMLLREWGEM